MQGLPRNPSLQPWPDTGETRQSMELVIAADSKPAPSSQGCVVALQSTTLCPRIAMGSVWIAAGAAFFCALAPNMLQAIGEGFFNRRRRVTGPGWVLAALGVVLSSAVSWLRRSALSRADSNALAVLIVLIVILAGLYFHQQWRCTRISGRGPCPQGLALRSGYWWEVHVMNAVGAAAFFGVVFFTLVFGEKLWSSWL